MDGWGGGQLAGGPMATRCDMIDWGCQRCPAGRRRTATNKGLQRLAVTPPRQRRRHCWSPHQSTKGGGTLAFLIRGEAGRCAGTLCWMPPLISGRPPLPPNLPLTLPPPSLHPQKCCRQNRGSRRLCVLFNANAYITRTRRRCHGLRSATRRWKINETHVQSDIN